MNFNVSQFTEVFKKKTIRIDILSINNYITIPKKKKNIFAKNYFLLN